VGLVGEEERPAECLSQQYKPAPLMSTAIFKKVLRLFARSLSPSRRCLCMPLAPSPSRTRGDAVVGAYAGAPARRRLSKGVWRRGRDIWAGGSLASSAPLSPRLPALASAFLALASVGQRWPALPFANAKALPANGLAVCQPQRLPTLASPSPAPASRCQPCQRPQLASVPSLPASAVASAGPQQPLQRQTGAAC
jgi:hypothetical protein